VCAIDDAAAVVVADGRTELFQHEADRNMGPGLRRGVLFGIDQQLLVATKYFSQKLRNSK
jgi:hypothetical protein